MADYENIENIENADDYIDYITNRKSAEEDIKWSVFSLQEIKEETYNEYLYRPIYDDTFYIGCTYRYIGNTNYPIYFSSEDSPLVAERLNLLGEIDAKIYVNQLLSKWDKEPYVMLFDTSKMSSKNIEKISLLIDKSIIKDKEEKTKGTIFEEKNNVEFIPQKSYSFLPFYLLLIFTLYSRA
jgi:hypothetical protein